MRLIVLRSLRVAPILATLAAPAGAANFDVNIGASLTFSPSTLAIQVGDSVTWHNNGGGFHNVVADDGSFRCAEGCADQGGNGDPSGAAWSFTRTFNLAGTVGYYCEVHGFSGGGMNGSITVQPSGGGDQAGMLAFSQAAYSIGEAGGSATITVRRLAGDDGAVTVHYATGGGSATAGADYSATSGTLSWANNDDTNKSFAVPITNDTLAESGETIGLDLSAATGGAVIDGTLGHATLTINDNDGTGGTVPVAPTHLTAAADSIASIMLDWEDKATIETGYEVERRALGGTFQKIDDLPANSTSYMDAGLPAATHFDYRVRAVNGAGTSPYSNEAGAATDAPIAPCVANSTTLCLNGGRFSARVHWRTSSDAGEAQTVPLPSAPDSGLFYFFSASNIEMLIKVLNACVPTLGNKYWVFYAATTNVEFTLTVTDTQRGKVKVYFNPLNRTAPPVQDVSAFATCP